MFTEMFACAAFGKAVRRIVADVPSGLYTARADKAVYKTKANPQCCPCEIYKASGRILCNCHLIPGP